MLKQLYDYYVKPYINIKGQNLVEYALLLAIVVGIGYGIYQFTGLGESIKSIFSSAGKLLDLAWKILPATFRYPMPKQ